MSARKDYRVTVKVRNNNLLLAIESAGYKVGKEFADIVGKPYTEINNLINMTLSPLDRYGNARSSVQRLCVVLNKTFDELFSNSQIDALQTNKSEVEMTAEQVYSLNLDSTSSPLEMLEHDEANEAVDNALDCLTPREKEVLRLRNGIDCQEHTLAAIGELFGVGVERIRQIEQKALRKLRHPRNATKLYGLYGVGSYYEENSTHH